MNAAAALACSLGEVPMFLLVALAAASQTLPPPVAGVVIPQPPIKHLVGPTTALVVTGDSPWRDASLIQTPGWLTSPAGDSLRGVAIGDVPVYVDGVRDFRVIRR